MSFLELTLFSKSMKCPGNFYIFLLTCTKTVYILQNEYSLGDIMFHRDMKNLTTVPYEAAAFLYAALCWNAVQQFYKWYTCL